MGAPVAGQGQPKPRYLASVRIWLQPGHTQGPSLLGQGPCLHHPDQELNIQKHSWHNDGDQSECEEGEVKAVPGSLAAAGTQAGEGDVIEPVPLHKRMLRSRRAVSVTAIPSRSCQSSTTRLVGGPISSHLTDRT